MPNPRRKSTARLLAYGGDAGRGVAAKPFVAPSWRKSTVKKQTTLPQISVITQKPISPRHTIAFLLGSDIDQQDQDEPAVATSLSLAPTPTLEPPPNTRPTPPLPQPSTLAFSASPAPPPVSPVQRDKHSLSFILGPSLQSMPPTPWLVHPAPAVLPTPLASPAPTTPSTSRSPVPTSLVQTPPLSAPPLSNFQYTNSGGFAVWSGCERALESFPRC
jgi:hypothetical protein